MEDEPYNFVKDSGVAWLTKGYQGLKAIDLGDKIYYRK